MSPEWITAALLALSFYSAIVTGLFALAISESASLFKECNRLRDSHQKLLAKLYGRP